MSEFARSWIPMGAKKWADLILIFAAWLIHRWEKLKRNDASLCDFPGALRVLEARGTPAAPTSTILIFFNGKSALRCRFPCFAVCFLMSV